MRKILIQTRLTIGGKVHDELILISHIIMKDNKAFESVKFGN